MARQIKAGLDYFSHDVDMLQDKKIRLIKAKHGLIGYAIYLRLLEELYRENGYYLQIDEDFNILFSGDNNIGLNDYINVLNDCINKNLFCEKMYKKHNILTSERVQKNYISGTDRRKEVNFIKEYLLVKPSEMYGDKVNVNINKLNVGINSLNDSTGTQRKGKEKKVNENTIKERIWKYFPNKKGQKDSFKKIDILLSDYSEEDLIRSIHNYIKSVEIERKNGFAELKYMNGSTFFNGRLLDYISEDYALPKLNNGKTEAESKEYNQKPRTQEEADYFHELERKDKHSDLWNDEMEKRLSKKKIRAEQSLLPQEMF